MQTSPRELGSGEIKFLDIGEILAPHGLKGELLIRLYTDFPERFASLRFVRVGENLRPYEVIGSDSHRSGVALRLRGVDSAEEARALRGQLLRIPLEDAVPLPADQYYWHQIIGLAVKTTEGEHLGQVVGILRTGANDVYVVRGPCGETLIPAIEDVVKDVDLANGEILVEILPGLL